MSVELTDINILDLLPQRPPFIMVDKLTYYDGISAKTVFTVRADNLFCKDGVMEEAGLVENIAQTCAARTGFKQRLDGCNSGGGGDAVPEQKFDKVKIGVIAMIHTLEMKRRPLVGEVLETSMVIEEEYFSTTLVRSEVKLGDETIATCRMKLFLTDKTPDEPAGTDYVPLWRGQGEVLPRQQENR
jgi:3-hydroxymyristoyl/3-hydroxydecanoyl-(acyl carrier protein) dehydratase